MNAQPKPDALQEIVDCKCPLHTRVDSESRFMSARSSIEMSDLIIRLQLLVTCYWLHISHSITARA